jgi:hypothetical protein
MKTHFITLLGLFSLGVITGAVIEARCRNVGDEFLKPMLDTADINVGDKVEYRYQDSLNYCKEMKVLALIATDNNNNLAWVRGNYCTLPNNQLGTYVLPLKNLVKIQ